eukprot:7792180-Prorocentrum_lima.AAC.1
MAFGQVDIPQRLQWENAQEGGEELVSGEGHRTSCPNDTAPNNSPMDPWGGAACIKAANAHARSITQKVGEGPELCQPCPGFILL